MDNFWEEFKDNEGLYAMTLLLISSKLNELDIDYISIKDLKLHFTKTWVKDSEIISWEWKILQDLNWDIAITCPC